MKITIIILDSPKKMGFDRAHTQIYNFLLFIETKIVGKRHKKVKFVLHLRLLPKKNFRAHKAKSQDVRSTTCKMLDAAAKIFRYSE